MPLSVIFHPFTWLIKYHTSADGKRKYLQDMDAKLKWIFSAAKHDQKAFNFIKARPLTWNDYMHVHSHNYIKKIQDGTKAEIEKYSWITWSKSYLRSQLYAGGILYHAAKTALEKGISGALMIDGHHARFDHGSGLCTFNHLAVVTKKILSQKTVLRVAIVDLDYHLGDGTIELLSKNKDVWIFDIYGGRHKSDYNEQAVIKKAFSVNKIDLGWNQYNSVLKEKLPLFLDSVEPNIVFYVAGVDIFQQDRYGGIDGIGINQVKSRDKYVFEEARKRKIPIVFSLGGGYVKYSGNISNDQTKRKQLTKLHINTLAEAAKLS